MNTELIAEVWDAITGSDFAGCDIFLKGIEGETLLYPSDLNLTYVTQDGGEAEKYITPQDLVDAYNKAKNETHCGGEPLDLDDYDACFAFIVLQYALYGTDYYG